MSTDDTSIMVYQNCNGNLANEYSVTNNLGYICGTNEYLLECLPAGDYYIEIGSSSDGAGEFEIEIEVLEELIFNDFCDNAGDPYDQTVLTNACAGAETSFCNINTLNAHDVWFEYELQFVSADITISIEEEDYGNDPANQVSIAVFQDCKLTPLDMHDPNVGLACDVLEGEIILNCVAGPSIFFVVSSQDGD